MTGATAPPSKRRFQPTITNYFAATSEDCEDPTSANPRREFHYSAPNYSPVPPLPAIFQTSSLSMGGRIRKAVAEGYKTSANMPDVSTTLTSSAKAPDVSVGMLPAPPTSTYSLGTSSYAELTPFSGMFKIRNLGPQSFPKSHVGTDDDDITLPSSQEYETEMASITHSGKRLFDTYYTDGDNGGDAHPW